MTSELKNQLARRNFDVEDVCESNEFCWDREDDIIYINIGNEPNDFGAWGEFMEELSLNFPFTEKAMAFMHELGHHITFDTFDEMEINLYRLYNIMLGMQIPSKESCAAYYHSDVEYAASAQAVEYANTYYDDMIELEEIFKG